MDSNAMVRVEDVYEVLRESKTGMRAGEIAEALRDRGLLRTDVKRATELIASILSNNIVRYFDKVARGVYRVKALSHSVQEQVTAQQETLKALGVETTTPPADPVRLRAYCEKTGFSLDFSFAPGTWIIVQPHQPLRLELLAS